jgi:hypothetical protein
MKTVTFVSLGLLTLSLAASAAAPDSRHVPVVERSIFGVLDGMVSFDVSDLSAVITIGDCAGIVTHLGAARLYTSHKCDGSRIIDGLFTLVAANGDQINGTYQGTVAWDWGQGIAIGQTVFAVAGGTGRFAQASGEITNTSTVTFLGWDILEWPVTWVFEGTVSY